VVTEGCRGSAKGPAAADKEEGYIVRRVKQSRRLGKQSQRNTSESRLTDTQLHQAEYDKSVIGHFEKTGEFPVSRHRLQSRDVAQRFAVEWDATERSGNVELMQIVIKKYEAQPQTLDLQTLLAGARNALLLSAVEQKATLRANNRRSQSPQNSPLPTVPQLRGWGSISQGQAADYLRCDRRTIRNYLMQKKLTRAGKKGRVRCDDSLVRLMRETHGDLPLK
jgi:hypothetical protein